MKILHLLESEFGGHVFDADDDLEWTACSNCFGGVSYWEINEGLWPARLGRYCPEILFKAPHIGETDGHD